ncbi:MAG TPA: glucose 1-dehydrogenase [Acetobacteraceae bacterium]|jgi:NAD(P)-dependent dehydrogenase (short-subunit alcohol dehydrogenase family)
MPQQSRRRAALVTGASYGIGAATAIGLAQDGFDVAVTDLTTEPLAHTIAAIEEAGSRALPLALDLRDQASVEKSIADAVAAFGGLDLLVNNAGVPSPGKPAIDISRADWDNNIAVNLTGTFFMSTAYGRWAIGAGMQGCIISLASTHGTVGYAGTSPYGISKAGISHMTRILAIEWAPHKIRVNAIAPGTTMTESRRPILQDPERHARMLTRIPLGRFGEPEEMAAAIRYLASPQASYITGQILLLDGGLTAY